MNDNYNENSISLAEVAGHLDVTKDSIRNWIRKTDIQLTKTENCGSSKNPSWTSG